MKKKHGVPSRTHKAYFSFAYVYNFRHTLISLPLVLILYKLNLSGIPSKFQFVSMFATVDLQTLYIIAHMFLHIHAVSLI